MRPGVGESLQGERNALLKYALLHPPRGVTVVLPPDVSSLDECDLTTCPSPLDLYRTAEAASDPHQRQDRKPAKPLVFDLAKYLTATFEGGGGGGVVRQVGSSSTTTSAVARETSALTTSSVKSRKTAADEATANSHSVTGSTSSRPTPTTSSHKKGDRAATDMDNDGKASAPSDNHGKHTGETGGAAATKHDESPSAISAFKSFFSGGGAASNSASSANARDPSHVTGSGAGAGAGADAKPVSTKPQGQGQGQTAQGTGSSGLFSVFFGKSRGGSHSSPNRKKELTGGSSIASCAAPTSKEVSEAVISCRMPDMAPEVLPMLPLNGTSAGILIDHVLKSLEPFLEPDSSGDAAKEGGSAGASAASLGSSPTAGSVPGFSVSALARANVPPSVIQPVSVTSPVVIEVCPIIDQSMMNAFDENVTITVYETILSAANFLLDVNRDKYEREILSVYRKVLNVSEEQHTRCVTNLIPTHLREGEVNREDLRLYIEGLRPDVRSLRTLIDASNDDEFVKRMAHLLETTLKYSDEDMTASTSGRTIYPLAIRATIYAAALIPIYRLDPRTERPLYEPKQIAHCTDALRRKLLIPQRIESYCHLHARLLANDEGVTMSMQCTFLKHVAKAVSVLGVRSLERERLSPSVKYCYYVLQETLAMSMTPMPWLESLCRTTDATKSVSAVFIETCAVLPTCFLSAFVRVNGNLLLPPTCPNGAFLYALLAVFISSSTLRKFTDGGEALLDAARARSGRDRAHLPAVMFKAVAEFDKAARDYCNLLQRSLPLSPYLALPGRFGIGNYLLNQQWFLDAHGGERSDGAARAGSAQLASFTAPVPETIVEDVWSMMRYIAAALPPNTPPVTKDAELSLVMSASSMRHLYSVGAMVRRHDEAHFRSLGTALGTRFEWSTSNVVTANAQAVPKDVARVLQRYGCPTLAPPLATSPSDVHYGRLRDFVANVTLLSQTLSPELPTSPSDAADNGNTTSAELPHRSSSFLHFRADSRGGSDTAGGGVAGAPAAGAGGGGNVPKAYADFQRLTQLRAAQKPLVELLQRLNAVYNLQQASVRFFDECANQYYQVMGVTGAPVVHCEGMWEQADSVLADAISRLCEWIAVAVLCTTPVGKDDHRDPNSATDPTRSGPAGDTTTTTDETAGTGPVDDKGKRKQNVSGARVNQDGGADKAGLGTAAAAAAIKDDGSLYGVMMNQFMKTDLVAYKQPKERSLHLFGGGKSKGSDRPLPRAFPQITMKRLMQVLDDAFDHCVAGHVPIPLYHQEIKCYATAFFVALLHTVYVEDVVTDVFFTPADADGIIADLDALSGHYFSGADSAAANGASARGADADAADRRVTGRPRQAQVGCRSGRVAHGPREEKGPRLLANLRGVVRYVMWQPSATLVNGGEGVPRFSTLPEFEENTPWCKYIVKRVLARRKDKVAKQAVSGKWYE